MKRARRTCVRVAARVVAPLAAATQGKASPAVCICKVSESTVAHSKDPKAVSSFLRHKSNMCDVSFATFHSVTCVGEGPLQPGGLSKETLNTVVDHCFKGNTATVVYWGAQGSLLDATSSRLSDGNVVPALVRELLEYSSKDKYELRVTCLKFSTTAPCIITDLLAECLEPRGSPLKLARSKQRGSYVRGCVEAVLSQPDQILDVLAHAHNTFTVNSKKQPSQQPAPRPASTGKVDTDGFGDIVVQIVFTDRETRTAGNIFLVALATSGHQAGCVPLDSEGTPQDTIERLVQSAPERETTYLVKLINDRVSQEAMLTIVATISAKKEDFPKTYPAIRFLTSICTLDHQPKRVRFADEAFCTLPAGGPPNADTTSPASARCAATRDSSESDILEDDDDDSHDGEWNDAELNQETAVNEEVESSADSSWLTSFSTNGTPNSSLEGRLAVLSQKHTTLVNAMLEKDRELERYSKLRIKFQRENQQLRSELAAAKQSQIKLGNQLEQCRAEAEEAAVKQDENSSLLLAETARCATLQEEVVKLQAAASQLRADVDDTTAHNTAVLQTEVRKYRIKMKKLQAEMVALKSNAENELITDKEKQLSTQQELSTALAASRKEKDSIAHQLARTSAELDQRKFECDTLKSRLNSLKPRLTTLKQREQEAIFFREKITALVAELTGTVPDVQLLASDPKSCVLALQQGIEHHKQLLASIAKQTQDGDNSSKTQELAFKLTQLQAKAQEFHASFQVKAAEVSSLKSELRGYKERERTYQNEITLLRNPKDKGETLHAEWSSKMMELHATCVDLETQLQSHRAELTAKNKEIAKLNEEIDQLNEQIIKIRTEKQERHGGLLPLPALSTAMEQKDAEISTLKSQLKTLNIQLLSAEKKANRVANTPPIVKQALPSPLPTLMSQFADLSLNIDASDQLRTQLRTVEDSKRSMALKMAEYQTRSIKLADRVKQLETLLQWVSVPDAAAQPGTPMANRSQPV
eukprot:TRINITY_DN8850_c0_g1_i1.p1 TRINITY_DN8850_c0_g1~~TRINITY_DN8850_c0_g1_i1.p1  ORF type:complete len:997 (+),score=207.40 TRINITY_DN8850_c0_g1_i1:34-2991(+)